jgi:hypothetical protein
MLPSSISISKKMPFSSSQSSNPTKKISHSLKYSVTKKDAQNVSLVRLLRIKLATINPKTRRTYGDSIIARYYKMAYDGDPIIMRDLINRIDGLPKQVIASDKDNPININVIHSLFGQSVRQANAIEYDTLLNEDDEVIPPKNKTNKV